MLPVSSPDYCHCVECYLGTEAVVIVALGFGLVTHHYPDQGTTVRLFLIFDTACDLAWSSITYFRNEIFF
jgi:hypothetical protein